MEIVLWLLMFAVMTLRDIHVCWKDTHWSMNMGTNRKATSKYVCLPYSEFMSFSGSTVPRSSTLHIYYSFTICRLTAHKKTDPYNKTT